MSSTKIEIGTHIIPKTNASFDIGSAEYKIRHLYLSDNSLWIGDKHKISITSDDKISFKKRKITKIPQILQNQGITGDNIIQNVNSNVDLNFTISNINEITLHQWLQISQYYTGIDDINVLFPDNEGDNYEQDFDLNTIKDTIDNLTYRIQQLEAIINPQ